PPPATSTSTLGSFPRDPRVQLTSDAGLLCGRAWFLQPSMAFPGPPPRPSPTRGEVWPPPPSWGRAGVGGGNAKDNTVRPLNSPLFAGPRWIVPPRHGEGGSGCLSA